jgi:hypothetical protein
MTVIFRKSSPRHLAPRLPSDFRIRRGYQMADNLQQRGTRDRCQISLSHQHELVYWTKRFSVRGEQLRRAVAAVGTIADDVERYLKSYEARH